MRLTFIGESTCIPDVGHEMACLLINGKHLMDTGWCGVLTMRQYGFDPLGLDSVIFTHLHQDHYIGLPQLLFYVGLRKRPQPEPFKIIGPGEHLQRVVNAAFELLQVHRFPELHVNHQVLPLAPGDRFELGELIFDTFAARHVSGHNRPEPALVYKVTQKDGGTVVFTGDTHYHPPIAEFAKGAAVLIHDGAHTSAKDAVTIAKMAAVEQLILIHYTQSHAERLLNEARQIFPNTNLAKAGETLEI